MRKRTNTELSRIIMEHEVERYIGTKLSYVIESLAENGIIDPPSKAIVWGVSPLARLPVSIMALTCCRWSELQNIDLVELLSIGRQEIYQPKVGSPRIVTIPWYAILDIPKEMLRQATLDRFSYDQLYSEIEAVIPPNVRKVLKQSFHVTHVFRHLRASWFHEKGASDAEISELLGHYLTTSNLSYLHKNLFM